ncbi:hypothetical protein F5Y14DRAFT_227622 [Nemania sp. NC0429]|nr:hypothetical protein F5Y14DRAFT_227622 [Nemania sp. NC0429]
MTNVPSAHEAFKALGPVDWESFARSDAQTLMTDIFQNAHCLISSIPPLPSRAAESSESPNAEVLRKEWKEVKINPRENSLGLDIYKLAAKDGKGSWFARRSVHDGLGFETWKTAMEREFAESLKVQGSPGDGKIRGLGADKRVVDQTVDGRGKIQVYQLSAQFPGPTAPRDFVTLCLSSDNAIPTPASDGVREPRSFTLVSKPCVHPECPVRQGFVRGSYESVELIREIRGTRPLGTPKANASSLSVTNSSDRNVGSESGISTPLGDDREHESKVSEHDGEEEGNPAIEWMMITRSDPGGSVPRFIIEKKTPEGIANDANKFMQWISSENFETLLQSDAEDTPADADTTRGTATISGISHAPAGSVLGQLDIPRAEPGLSTAKRNGPESPGPGGVYGMISGALGMVASAAASRILGAPGENESDSENSLPDVSDSSSSSIHSFHSFDTTGNSEEPSLSISLKAADEEPSPSADSTSVSSARHDKELMKLEQRKQKTEEKLRRAQERALAKKDDDAQRSELAQKKLREKHEREMAKQEEKYQRELHKLEARRAGEEKKAEERRRKQAERELKANLALELDKTRAERDVARKENEILAEQVRRLQALNTRLVARLGRAGIGLDDDDGGEDDDYDDTKSGFKSSAFNSRNLSGSVAGSTKSRDVN